MGIKDSSIMPVIAVDDLDRAMAFYRDKLGLTVRRLEQDPSSAIVDVGDSKLLLYRSTFRRGETTVASFIVDDIDKVVGELRGRGVEFEEYDFPGLKTVEGVAALGDLKSSWFKDSEGNTIAITSGATEMMRKAA